MKIESIYDKNQENYFNRTFVCQKCKKVLSYVKAVRLINENFGVCHKCAVENEMKIFDDILKSLLPN